MCKICSTSELTSLGKTLILCSSFNHELTCLALAPVALGSTNMPTTITSKKLKLSVRHYIRVLAQEKGESIYLRCNSVSLTIFYFPIYQISMRPKSSREDLLLQCSLGLIKITVCYAPRSRWGKWSSLPSWLQTGNTLFMIIKDHVYLTCSEKPLTG